MSNSKPHLFSATLASLMQERGMNQVELHKRTGIAVSRVNNYLHGNYRTIKPAHIAAFDACLCSVPADKSALAQAYLFDLLPEALRGIVDIRVSGTRESGNWELPVRGLPREFAQEWREFYVLRTSCSKARARTAEWVSIMRETSR